MNDVGIKITAQDQTGNSFSSVGGKLSNLQKEAQGIGGTIGGLVSQFNALGLVLGGGLSLSAIKGAAGELIKVQREFDVLNASLITVTGSSYKAQQEFAWIKQFAATTPYQLNEVTGAFVKMKAMGLDASQAALTSYGNTASAMGKGINQMIEAVSDAATGEFERLKEFGIKASKQGDQVSLTFQGVTTSIGNNAKEITRYLQDIGNVEFAGAMEERAKTLDGAISNLADNWSALLRTVNQGGFAQAVANDVRTLNTELQGLNDAMLNSQNAGDGLFKQFANSAGFAIGSAAMGTLNSTANGLNWTINALTGGFFHLNENVKLLPESLMTNEQRAAALSGKLQDAEADLSKLQARLAIVPDNIYLKDSTYQAYLLVQQLREVKTAQDNLSKTPQKSQSESRIKASNAYGEEQAKAQQKVADLMTASSGVSDAYIKRMKEIGEANATGAMSQYQLNTALEAAHGLLKKDTAGIAAHKKELSEAAKALAFYSDLVDESSGYSKTYAEDQNKLALAFKTGAISSDQYAVSVQKLLDKQPAMAAAEKLRIEVAKENTKAVDDLFDAQEKLRLSNEDQIKTGRSLLDQIEFETRLLDMNAEARAQATMERELEAKGIVKGTQAYDAYIIKLREAMSIKTGRELSIKAADDMAAEQKKAAEESSKYWEDALMRAFESGKGFFQSLWDTIKNTLKTQILKVSIQGVMGGLGMGAAGAASAGSSVLGSVGSSLIGNSISSLIPASFSTFGTSALAGIQSMVGMTGTVAQASTAAANGIAAAAQLQSGVAVTGSTAAGLGSTLAAAAPYIAAAVIAYELLTGNKTKSSEANGNADKVYSADGSIAQQSLGAGSSFDVYNKGVDALAKSYFDSAKALGITAVAGAFALGGNTGKQGENPTTSVISNFGKSEFRSGEISSADQSAITLATSRALLNALQASELPKYLSGVFDGLTASSATQDQITASLNNATALKTFNAALEMMPAHFQGVADLSYTATQALIGFSGGLDALSTNLGTYYTNFYSAEDQRQQMIKNINAATAGSGLDAATATRDSFRDIVEAQDLTTESGQKMYAALLGVAGAFAGITQSSDDLAKAAADAAKAAADAAKAIADAAKVAQTASLKSNLDLATTAASDAYDTLSRAVEAQRATDTAKYEADKAIATAAYTSQQTLMQASIDSTRASLDAVTASVGKLKSLSNSLKSTLDGMRIAGSDSAYRAAAQAQIRDTLATALSGGGLPLDGQLDSALRTVSKPSEQLFGSFEDYARDFYKTANDISALSDLTDAQLTADEITQGILQAQSDTLTEQQKLLKDGFNDQVSVLDDILSNAQKQLDAANGLDVSVLSVAAALSAFNASISALVAERTAQAMPTAGVSAAANYMTTNTDVAAAYKENTYGLSATDYASVHYGLYGQDEGRASPIATPAATAKSYFQLYPDVAAAFAANTYGLSQVEFSARHFANFGKAEGRTYPGFATGINYVPADMTANIHKGEAVIPAAYNPYNPDAKSSNKDDEIVAELRSLADCLDRIEASTRATAGHTAGTDRKLARVIPGNALITEDAV